MHIVVKPELEYGITNCPFYHEMRCSIKGCIDQCPESTAHDDGTYSAVLPEDCPLKSGSVTIKLAEDGTDNEQRKD